MLTHSKAGKSYVSQNPSLMLSFLPKGESSMARWERRHRELLQKLCLVTPNGGGSGLSEHIRRDLASKSGESSWLLEDTQTNRGALKEGKVPFNSRVFLGEEENGTSALHLSEIYQVRFAKKKTIDLFLPCFPISRLVKAAPLWSSLWERQLLSWWRMTGKYGRGERICR